MMRNHEVLHAHGVGVQAPGGRPLIAELSLSLQFGDRAALVGRNGVGKSCLLQVLAGQAVSTVGQVHRQGTCVLVPQLLSSLPGKGLSPGQLRRYHLERALDDDPTLLLLDEPTLDLDRVGLQWLRQSISAFDGALLVVSHERQLLRMFADFFLLSESGGRHVSGSLDHVLDALRAQEEVRRQRYGRQLLRLGKQEERHIRVARRMARKRNVGRIRQLDRSPSRMALNQRRGAAQASQGKADAVHETRRVQARAWVQAQRRALEVALPLAVPWPELPAPRAPVLTLQDVHLLKAGQRVCTGLSLRVLNQRVAVVGDNGTGKSSLLDVMAGLCRPDSGRVWGDYARVGYIAQNAANFQQDDCLLALLASQSGEDLDATALTLRLHRFPESLAQRPLRSLSPGERVRAALILLCCRVPTPAVLLLDEPTAHLDLLGLAALQAALCAYPGALVVASHDRELLAALGIRQVLQLRRQTA